MKWGDLEIRALPGRRWVLTMNFVVDTLPEIDLRPYVEDSVVVVPRYFTTDLASIPRLFKGLLEEDAEWAAVVHDWFWRRNSPLPHRARDRLFRLMLKAAGVSWFRRWVMWGVVRLWSLVKFGG